MLDDVPSQGGDRRKVVLDASWLILGKRYQLCVDLDGASSAFSAGPVAEITVTPITQVKPVAIRQRSAQRVELRCSECTSASLVHLSKAATCITAASSFGDVQAHTLLGSDGTNPQTLRPLGADAERKHERWFEFTVDASMLTAGITYYICLDVDGTSGALVSVDAGWNMLISGVHELATPSVAPASEQIVQFRCEAVTCSLASALLSSSCDTSDTNAVTVASPSNTAAVPLSLALAAADSAIGFAAGFDGAAYNDTDLPLRTMQAPLPSTEAGRWYQIRLDASHLQAGGRYQLCVDLDGSGPLALQDTGFTLFVSPFACSGLGGGAGINPAPAQTLELRCVASKTASCASATGYLGKTCDTPGISSMPRKYWASPVASIQASLEAHNRAVPAWKLVVDASSLEPGSSYHVCISPKGGHKPEDFIDLGCKVYVAGIASVEPVSIQVNQQPHQRQHFDVHCASTSGCRVGMPVALCDTRSPGKQVTKRTEQAMLQRARDRWEVSLSPAGLVAGNYYKLCVDMESGAMDTALIDTGVALFARGGTSVEPSFAQRRSGVILRLRCDIGCNSRTEIFLSSTCQPDELSFAPYRGRVELHKPASPILKTRSERVIEDPDNTIEGVIFWIATIDLQPLQAGTTVKLCVDYDGATGSQLSGDSGATLYIAGVIAVNRTSIRRGMNQALMLSCTEGCIDRISQAFLALDCAQEKYLAGVNSPHSTSTARATMVGSPSKGFEVVLDTRNLPVGAELSLCTDLDGTKPGLVAGDSGHRLHATAIAFWNSTASTQGHISISQTGGQEIRLSCQGGCTMDTTVTLVAHTAKCSASTTTIAGLLPDGEAAYAGALGGFGNIAWKAIFDASQLAVGKYRLCADLDGHGPLYSSGDTDELVDVVKSR